MERIIIESPFRGINQSEQLLFVSYLGKCIRDSIDRGECPFASHRMYPGALDDGSPAERALGIHL